MSAKETVSTLSGSAPGSASGPIVESEGSPSDTSSVAPSVASEADAVSTTLSASCVHAVRVACRELIIVADALHAGGVSNNMRQALQVAAAREAGDMIVSTINNEIGGLK